VHGHVEVGAGDGVSVDPPDFIRPAISQHQPPTGVSQVNILAINGDGGDMCRFVKFQRGRHGLAVSPTLDPIVKRDEHSRFAPSHRRGFAGKRPCFVHLPGNRIEPVDTRIT